MQVFYRKISKRAMNRTPILPFGEEKTVHIKGTVTEGRIEMVDRNGEEIIDETSIVHAEHAFLQGMGGVMQRLKERKESGGSTDQAKGSREIPSSPKKTYVAPGKRRGTNGGGDGDGIIGPNRCLKITNLSRDITENDIRAIFGHPKKFGPIERVYLSRHPQTGQCSGLSFVTYYKHEDADYAKEKLTGCGVDNLIMCIEWADPPRKRS